MSGYRLALGLPKWFNRVQEYSNIYLYNSQKEQEEDFPFDIFNLPVWVYKKGKYLFVSVYSPRVSLKNIMVINNGNIDDIVVNNSANSIDVKVEHMNFKPLVLTKDIVNSMD